MPTFCRHGRMLANCPICSKSAEPSRAEPRSPRAVRSRTGAPRAKAASGMKVRRVERAADDGYDHELVGGVRSTVDAARLADELAFSAARLVELAADPPGAYAQVRGATDPEEAIWLALLIAYVGGPEAAAGLALPSWASGADTVDLGAARLGPRAAHDPARGDTLASYRGWAQRGGGQQAALAGEPGWEPERRFARAFERMALPGLGRSAKFEFLTTLGVLGILPMAPGALFVSDARDPVVLAAKRVLGIGDAINLERRAKDLAAGTGVPMAALDLALSNWAAPEDERATMGATVAADPARRAKIGKALGV